MLSEIVEAIIIIILVGTLVYWKNPQRIEELDEEESKQDTDLDEEEEINRRCRIRFIPKIQQKIPPKKQTGSEKISKFKQKLIKDSYCIESEASMKLYKLKLYETSKKDISKIQRNHFGRSKTGSYIQNEKVIMILGATGSGKTTLINSMINYVFGVEYEDKFRFKLVTEEESGGRNQAHSQTSWITAYTIHHQNGFKVPYTLTIIDTPGFGNTKGIQRDTEITKQINNFFNVHGDEGIDHIDAVAFVSQSSLPRLTLAQKYIFDQILSLFGKDIGENIYLMLTFSDGKAPQVLNGIEEARMPYQEFFKFNNSVIFDDNTAEDEFATMFWKMGMRSFEKFFEHFSNIVPKSLTQTKSVLRERERIETQITGLKFEIKKGQNKLELLKKEVEVVEQHKADLERNKQHVSMRYQLISERREVTKTSEDLKQKYKDASGKVKSATQIIEDMVDEFEAVQIKILGITEVLRKSINNLNEIALKPNPLSTDEYIRILIESEKSAAEPGWQDRVDQKKK